MDKLKRLKIDFMWDYSNAPTIETFMDDELCQKISSEHRYRVCELSGGCKSVLSIHESGISDFLYHNPSDEKGFDGREFKIKTTDYEELVLKGPWSSNCKVIKINFGEDIYQGIIRVKDTLAYSAYFHIPIPREELNDMLEDVKDKAGFKRGSDYPDSHETLEKYGSDKLWNALIEIDERLDSWIKAQESDGVK